jgi:hypothetical protein
MTKEYSSSVSQQLDQAITRGEVDLANPPPDLNGLQEIARELRSAELALSKRAESWTDYLSFIAKMKSGNEDIRKVQRMSLAKTARIQRRLRLRIFWKKWHTTIIVLFVTIAVAVLIYVFRQTLLEGLSALRELFERDQPTATPAPTTVAPTAPQVPSGGNP